MVQMCSAGWQPAVSRAGSPQGIRLEREVTSKAGGTRRLSTGDTADYQSAIRQLAGIPSHYLRQVTDLNQDLSEFSDGGKPQFAATKKGARSIFSTSISG
jgi:hypothetical protein